MEVNIGPKETIPTGDAETTGNTGWENMEYRKVDTKEYVETGLADGSLEVFETAKHILQAIEPRAKLVERKVNTYKNGRDLTAIYKGKMRDKCRILGMVNLVSARIEERYPCFLCTFAQCVVGLIMPGFNNIQRGLTRETAEL